MQVSERHFLELKRAYAAQLRRKDNEIDELKRRNDILMRTAMKQNEKLVQMEEYVKKIMKQKK